MSDTVKVCAVGDFPPGTARQVTLQDSTIAVVRVGDDFYALGDRCSHANFSLSEGEVDCDERTIECWKHGAQFSLADGAALSLPATKAVAVYDVAVIDAEVVVSFPEVTP